MSEFELWLREEFRSTERRTPLLPEGAKELVDAGVKVVVEESEKRIFSNEAYAEAGCELVKAGSWQRAPRSATILGLKELPSQPCALRNTHVYFAHAFKEQAGWQDLLTRFEVGGGNLLDIEYMVDANARRVVAFGYWAGYMGAALALMQWYDRKARRSSTIAKELQPFNCADTLDGIIRNLKTEGEAPKALVIGAAGRSGKGAAEILERHGIAVTKWGRKETADLDRSVLLEHDILVNCSFVADMIPPFLRKEDLVEGMKLQVISDVSCDPFSEFNPLPLYEAPTPWDVPFVTVENGSASLDLIAIDNLPSLLPKEASDEFAGLLLPYLKTLGKPEADPVWAASKASFDAACEQMHAAIKIAS
ncbi:saccharopine dehydrogenase [Kordiimonas laminariae]|uniref:saccharopine dehydrogenase n=1 Tax=Kordiimonas laminariae TaxID=2917717 RepID=UPI001FF38EAE|nr:saccharopine dehydrogenase [Kordiimonas laminariae]MCK0071168.1 saccharopine dehydrogenase [Kordiimonas laminariae]